MYVSILPTLNTVREAGNLEVQQFEWLPLDTMFVTLSFQEPVPWKISNVRTITRESHLKPVRVIDVGKRYFAQYHLDFIVRLMINYGVCAKNTSGQECFMIRGGIHRIYFTRQLGMTHICACVHRDYEAKSLVGPFETEEDEEKAFSFFKHRFWGINSREEWRAFHTKLLNRIRELDR